MPGAQQLRGPLAAALSIELYRLELLMVRIWQLFGLLGVVTGLLIAATLSRPMGLACSATAAVFLLWFVLAERWMAKDARRNAVRAVSIVIEAAVPWAFTMVLVLTQGAEYALSSWVPPMLFCALIMGYAARLRPYACLGSGVIGAAIYLVLYWSMVRGRLSADAGRMLVFQPAMQVTRSGALFVAGALCMLVARSQRMAFARAELAVREQDLFGKYRLVRPLASGAMGTVFEAVYCPEGGFERRVAIKRIHAHLAQQPKFVDAFRREAELCARLAHPNVIQVMDFGRVGDAYFLAMEYVDGMTLWELAERARTRRRALSVGLVGHVGHEILAGLVHAHEEARGPDGSPLRIVHRDLCPQNVLVSSNGQVKLSDFGVARALRGAVVAETKTIGGHLAYMAPEQARGEAFDPRSDLFPIGVILWELLAGRQLFRRENEAATVYALLSDEAPPASGRAGVDGTWDAFLSRALARDPDERFASAREMLAALTPLPGMETEGAGQKLAALVTELADP